MALCKTWPAGPGCTLCLPRSGACTLLRTWCRQPRVRPPGLRHSCLGDSRLQCSVPPLPAEACSLAWRDVLRRSLGLRREALPLPGALHPPVLQAGLSVLTESSLLCWRGQPPAASAKPCLCPLSPAGPLQHPGFQGESLSQLTSSELEKTSLPLVMPQHQFVTHFTPRWPPASPLYGIFLSHGCSSWAQA